MKLKFKGYEGSFEYDGLGKCYHGKILGISDLVSYELDTLANLLWEFQIAVDDYLDTCAELNKEPQIPVYE